MSRVSHLQLEANDKKLNPLIYFPTHLCSLVGVSVGSLGFFGHS